jgi:hypothetical protein
MDIVNHGPHGLEQFYHAWDALLQGLYGFPGLWVFRFGMHDEVFEDEGRVSEENEVRLGKVPLTEIDLALESRMLACMRLQLTSGRRTNLMVDGLGRACPVLEADARVPVELLCSLGQLPGAHGPAAHVQIRAAHDGIGDEQHLSEM